MKNIKIFSTQTLNKDSFQIKNDIFVPIGYNSNDYKNVPLDNKKYCELCSQWYAWKLVDADYYGFCHYRRYFSFAETNDERTPWNIIVCKYLNAANAEKYGLSDCKKIHSLVEKNDIISIEPTDLSKVKIKSVYEQYKSGAKLHLEDLDKMMCLIKTHYPNIFPAAKEYMNGTNFYSCNMFIMRKDLFFEYSKFLFDILEKFEMDNDLSLYSVEGQRTLGHLGERLFGIYYTYLKNKNIYTFCDLPLVFFENTGSGKILTKAYPDGIGVVLASSEYYAPFASATLQSIIDNTSINNNYDIVILTKNLSEKSKDMFLKQIMGKSNISLRIYDVGSFFANYNLYESPTISIETYFRLVIPEILPDYEKIVYLDSDLIVKADIADFYNTDLSDNLLAGVIDIANSGCVNGFSPEMADYYTITLGMRNPCNIINMGVIVINCAEFRKKYDTKYLLEFALQGAFKFQDQDMLNIICEDRIKYIDPSWNYFADPKDGYRGYIESFAPAKQYETYMAAKKNIKIVHYAGNEKPWKHDTCDYEYADEFWTEFIKTPFYGAFMFKHSTDVACNNNNHPKSKKLWRRIANKLFPVRTIRRKYAKKIYRTLKKVLHK